MGGQLAADELARGIVPETRQLAAEYVGEDLAVLVTVNLLQQTVLLGTGQALEVRLGAHGALLGIEACLGDQLDRLV